MERFNADKRYDLNCVFRVVVHAEIQVFWEEQAEKWQIQVLPGYLGDLVRPYLEKGLTVEALG